MPTNRPYNYKQVIEIIGITYRQLDHWDRAGLVKPSITKKHGRGKKRLYSFSDLVALGTAKQLKDQGIPLKKMKKCLKFIKDRFRPHGHPFAEFLIFTDGKRILMRDPEAEAVVDTLRGGQMLLAIGVGALAEQINGKILKIGLS